MDTVTEVTETEGTFPLAEMAATEDNTEDECPTSKIVEVGYGLGV